MRRAGTVSELEVIILELYKEKRKEFLRNLPRQYVPGSIVLNVDYEDVLRVYTARNSKPPSEDIFRRKARKVIDDFCESRAYYWRLEGKTSAEIATALATEGFPYYTVSTAKKKADLYTQKYLANPEYRINLETQRLMKTQVFEREANFWVRESHNTMLSLSDRVKAASSAIKYFDLICKVGGYYFTPESTGDRTYFQAFESLLGELREKATQAGREDLVNEVLQLLTTASSPKAHTEVYSAEEE